MIGLATAYQLSRRLPRLRLVILEKESQPALHQTGHNSGVLHSGVYYRPGSLKARNCREGKRAMEEFCAAEGVPFEICGKVIVAVADDQLPALHMLHERGQANGVLRSSSWKRAPICWWTNMVWKRQLNPRSYPILKYPWLISSQVEAKPTKRVFLLPPTNRATSNM